MAEKLPLVLGSEGLIEQLQAGDSLAMPEALGLILVQNQLILKLLGSLILQKDLELLSSEDLNSFLQELL